MCYIYRTLKTEYTMECRESTMFYYNEYRRINERSYFCLSFKELSKLEIKI